MAPSNAPCTVVIPCYNVEQYLEAAVKSVLAQTCQRYHLVIVDDGSRDNTRTLARSLAKGNSKITYIELPENRGRSHARNRGAQATRSPYLAFLDADDTYHPDFLKETIAVLSQSPQLDAVKVQPEISISVDPLRYQAVVNSLVTTMLLRRAPFEWIGGWPESNVFREHPGAMEDLVFLNLFSAVFQTEVLEKKLYYYLHRPGNCLDQFLARSVVSDGKLVIREQTEHDEKADAENRRLLNELRAKVRGVIVERLKGESTMKSIR